MPITMTISEFIELACGYGYSVAFKSRKAGGYYAAVRNAKGTTATGKGDTVSEALADALYALATGNEGIL